MGAVADFVGGAADFVGDAFGGVADFVGDVASNVDIGDALTTFILSGGNPYAAAFAATDFDEDLGFNPLSFYDPVSGGFDFGFDNLTQPGQIPGGGYQGGFIKTGIDTLDKALSVAKSGYDLYNLYDQQQSVQQPIPSLTYQQTSSGTQVDPNAFGQGLQFISISNLPELGSIKDIITKSVSGLGNILLNAFGTDNLSEVIKKYGPAVLSVIGGKLSYDDQKRINDIVMGAYNRYNVGTELKKLQYRTGEGLASLPIFRSTKQLGSQTAPSAPQRTAADVVVRPQAQMGGIMQLGNEQEEPIFPRLETLSQNLGQAEQTLGQPSNQSSMSSITTAITGQQPKGFAEGGSSSKIEDLLDEYKKFKMRKDEGRMRFAMGSTQQSMQMQSSKNIPPAMLTNQFKKRIMSDSKTMENLMKNPKFLNILNSIKNKKASNNLNSQQGRPGYKFGSLPMRTNQAGITEIDYRQKGGFVPPIGVKEKADDIPAMLSNNEFVFTANAVRGAGGGSVKKGAERMYGLMKQLEGKA